MSGPLLDRIDLHIEVPAAYKGLRGFYNSRIPSRQLRKLCALDDAGERTLEMAVRRMGFERQRARPNSQSLAPSRI